MIPEDKELLLKDLCARQPYKVKISVDDDYDLFIPRLKYIDGFICYFYECAWTKYLDEIKPYLRPMSSMTEEEKNDLFQLMGRGTDIERIDFYISHHLDYRGLIPMGLALEALEGMYN